MKKGTNYLVGLIAFCWLSCLPAWAQFSIAGTISDAEGRALPGATVTLEGTFQGTSADASGAYELTNVKPGTYRARVSLLGFEPVIKTVDVKADLMLSVLLTKSATVMDEVVVSATRANDKSAIAYTTVSRTELNKLNLGQDLPILLNFTPSVVTTSDAGAGVGYTGIRIRGSDATRVNVTLNGIPYNDAESQGTYFVDLPDFASSVSSVQIQRGVGTSTNGAGAFGASMNIQTNNLQKDPYAETNISGGSFGTLKTNLQAGTGLINKHWVVDARLSNISSDGYIDRAFSKLKSFYASGGYYTDKSYLRLNIFSGQEQTYQAWNGIPESILKTNRRYNQFTYDNQTDNYQQDNYQLIGSHELSRNWRLNGALFWTKGKGYYEEYRPNDDLSSYGIAPIVIRDTTITQTDIIRRRWLDNNFYGGVFSLDYNSFGKLTANIGGGVNQYRGKHYGEVIWARFAGNSNIRQRYYEDNATKNDLNLYAKAFYQFTPKLNAFGDLQVRNVYYSFLGFDRNLRNVQQSANLTFFNPKAGITYTISDRQTVYASYGVGNREPNRDDYTNSSPDSRPKAETLHDWEAGYKLRTERIAFTANGYYMNYKNQLVLTGQINDVGGYTRINIPKSYRLGIELELATTLTKQLRWNVNATFSRNKIASFAEYLDNYDTGNQEVQQHNQTDISFSPNVIMGSQLLFTPIKRLEIGLLSKYVGQQYLDNTSSQNRKINPYFVNDLRLIYTVKPKFMQEITFTFLLNNVFNERYESNGYTYAYLTEGKVVADNWYYPQAGRNFLTGVRIKF